jgi:hypothetical protein
VLHEKVSEAHLFKKLHRYAEIAAGIACCLAQLGCTHTPDIEPGFVFVAQRSF